MKMRQRRKQFQFGIRLVGEIKIKHAMPELGITMRAWGEGIYRRQQ